MHQALPTGDDCGRPIAPYTSCKRSWVDGAFQSLAAPLAMAAAYRHSDDQTDVWLDEVSRS